VGTLFFCFLTFLLAAYVILDGYDLGAGMLHLRIARGDEERRQVLATIGPLWDGNEVYLVAAGGTLFFAFPELYAVSFSGFYLPLMIVLWLLIVRGASIELRSHLPSPLWRQALDVGFSLSSLLLAFFLGVALGNVVRGVPMGPDRWFLAPLWTTFGLGRDTGILDWYTLLVGATSAVVIAEQGALWIALRASGPVHDRARALVLPLWAPAAALTVAMTGVTFLVQPRVPQALLHEPWRLAFPALAVAALAATPLAHRRRRNGLAFATWSAFLALLVASAAFGLYPWLLPSTLDPRFALTVEEARAADPSLRIGAVWWPIGVGLAVFYTAYVHWRFSVSPPPRPRRAPSPRASAPR
jgi:cytochrome d ubiquinol oxidase subunit II